MPIFSRSVTVLALTGLLLSCSFSYAEPPQLVSQQVLETRRSEIANDFFFTPGQEFCIVGERVNSPTSSDLRFLRGSFPKYLDWAMVYHYFEKNAGYSILQSSDSNYVMAGYTQSGTQRYVWVLKVDEHGNEVWSNVNGGTPWREARCIRELSDGGFVVCGLETNPDANVLLQKISATGDLVWSHTYGTTMNDTAFAVEELPDGGFILCGIKGVFNSNDTDGYLIRTDANGDTLWTRSFNTSVYEAFYDFKIDVDGGFVMCGRKHNVPESTSGWVMKTDSDGNILWDHFFAPSLGCKLFGIILHPDSGYVAVGTYISNGGYTGGTTLRLRPDGELMEERSNQLERKDAAILQSGRILLCGSSSYNSISSIGLEETFGDTVFSWDDFYGAIDDYSKVGYAADGNLFACTRYVLTKFGSDGNVIWKRFNGEHNFYSAYQYATYTPSFDNGFWEADKDSMFKTDVYGEPVFGIAFPGQIINGASHLFETSDHGLTAALSQFTAEANISRGVFHYDSTGHLLWQWNESGDLGDVEDLIVVEMDEGVIAGGGITLQGNAEEGFVARISSSGDTEWLRIVDSTEDSRVKNVLIDGDSLTVISYSQNDHMSVTRMSLTGEIALQRMLDSRLGPPSKVSVLTDGTFIMSQGGQNSSAKFDASGRVIWMGAPSGNVIPLGNEEFLLQRKIDSVNVLERYSGGSPEAYLSLFPSYYSFGYIHALDSAFADFTLVNTGILPVTIAIADMESPVYSYVFEGNQTLEVDSSRALQIRFLPQGQEDNFFDTLAIFYDGELSPFNVFIYGGSSYTYLSTVPSYCDFGWVAIGDTAVIPVTMSAAFLGDTITITGVNAFPDVFCDLPIPTTLIVGGEAVNFNVYFVPIAETLATHSFYCDFDGISRYAFTGYGHGNFRELSLPESGTLNFDSVAVDSSRTQILRIENTKRVEIRIDSVTIDSGFTLSGEWPLVLSPRRGMELEVTFTPLIPMDYDGTLRFFTNGFDPVVSVNLHGFGVFQSSADRGDREIPAEFNITQAYPNPFNPSTKFILEFPVASELNVAVFDVLGRTVSQFDGFYPAGYNSWDWNCPACGSGTYYFAFETSAYSTVRKASLIR